MTTLRAFSIILLVFKILFLILLSFSQKSFVERVFPCVVERQTEEELFALNFLQFNVTLKRSHHRPQTRKPTIPI